MIQRQSIQRSCGRAVRGLAAVAFAAFCGLSTADAGPVRFDGEGHAYHPVFSIDGKHLAFEVNRYAGSVDLFISDLNGDLAKDGLKVALPGGSSAFGGSKQVVANPVWHPMGITVFEGSNQGGNYRLYYAQPGGAAAAEMIRTTELPGDLSFPTVSPDGSKMAFVADETGAGDLRSRDTSSGQIDQLTRSPTAEMFPSYNKDGSKILFTRKANGAEDVFELTVSSQAENGVASGNGDQTRPAYAAGGNTIVYFDGSRGDETWDIVANTGGSKKTIGRDVRLPHRARPSVSPDGKWVAYGHSDPNKSSRITVVSLDGSKSIDILPPDPSKPYVAMGEPAMGAKDGRIYLAYTALPNTGSTWRFLYVTDITDKLK